MFRGGAPGRALIGNEGRTRRHAGNFELNVRVPMMTRNVFDSIRLLTSASRMLAEKCVDGLEPNEESLRRHAESTPAIATALNPFIGYDLGTEIVNEAVASSRTIREVAIEKGVDEETLDKALDLHRWRAVEAEQVRAGYAGARQSWRGGVELGARVATSVCDRDRGGNTAAVPGTGVHPQLPGTPPHRVGELAACHRLQQVVMVDRHRVLRSSIAGEARAWRSIPRSHGVASRHWRPTKSGMWTLGDRRLAERWRTTTRLP